jgi:HEPN domain-containing protein
MIPTQDLSKIAKARLRDAVVLRASRRYDGAIYLCGYAIELALKARICKTLKWEGYPDSVREFRPYKSFQTHNLHVLLHLSGREAKIKVGFLKAWSGVTQWDPTLRYKPIGSAKNADVQDMISSAQMLLGEI